MATQVNGTSLEYSAEMVGNAFVTRFYTFLHEKPEMVHKFFEDSSTMSRPGPDGALKTVSTMKEINDLILSFSCGDYKAEIFTADSQASYMKGVFVLVTGSFTGKDNVGRKFTESFFLAPQDNGYFVLNNVFRFLDDHLQLDNSMEKNYETNASTASVPIEGIVEVLDKSIEIQPGMAEVAHENKAEVSNSANDPQKATVAETAISQAPAVTATGAQQVVETSSNGHVDASKKSYASLLKGMKDGATATLVHTPSSSAKAVAANTAPQSASSPPKQQSRIETVPATLSEPSAPNGGNVSTSSTGQAEDHGYSIYVGDLPWNATIELVEREFKKFGPIKRNGIQVRSNKGYCFGFVEYEDASSKQKAIEMGTLAIGGKEAFIQEKKTSTRVVNGVSTYPSGRGGFRSGGNFRGRGNYSNGRGYVKNDYSKRNGEVTSRNNHQPNGYGYQNGRGRGVRQGVVSK